MMAGELMEWSGHRRQTVEDVRTLWGYIGFNDRLRWVDRLRGLFGDDFTATVACLSGRTEIPYEEQPSKRLRVKIYWQLRGGHVHAKMFVGLVDPSWTDEQCVGHCGMSAKLVLREEEWAPFVAAQVRAGTIFEEETERG